MVIKRITTMAINMRLVINSFLALRRTSPIDASSLEPTDACLVEPTSLTCSTLCFNQIPPKTQLLKISATNTIPQGSRCDNNFLIYIIYKTLRFQCLFRHIGVISHIFLCKDLHYAAARSHEDLRYTRILYRNSSPERR